MTLVLLPALRSDGATYNVSVRQVGRMFEGIGGLSGGGVGGKISKRNAKAVCVQATSKLLVNYPPEQRADILDILFRVLSVLFLFSFLLPAASLRRRASSAKSRNWR